MTEDWLIFRKSWSSVLTKAKNWSNLLIRAILKSDKLNRSSSLISLSNLIYLLYYSHCDYLKHETWLSSWWLTVNPGHSQLLVNDLNGFIDFIYSPRNSSVVKSFLKNLCYLLDWKPFKNNKKWFYFIWKALFVLKKFQGFFTTFRLCRKNGFIRKITLTSKFMMSQHGLQTIAIHILSSISQCRGNQAMKFGQLIEYNKRNIFLQKLCGK